ncbi:MAG TPA: hypothetical protein VMT30_06365 [Candidatus Saccharimonadia bacterium]|nr:hypothetical protein [Candidatus Saccharimonadia bacterium]
MTQNFTDLDWLLYFTTWIFLPALSAAMVYFALKPGKSLGAYKINLGLVAIILLALIPALDSAIGYWNAGSPKLALLAIGLSLAILLIRKFRTRH